MINAETIQMLDPSMIGDSSDDPDDPRKRMVRQFALTAMRQLAGGEADVGGGGGGGDSGSGSNTLPIADHENEDTDGGYNDGSGAAAIGKLSPQEKDVVGGSSASNNALEMPQLRKADAGAGVPQPPPVSDDTTDDAGIPNVMPATAGKNAAAARLQRAQAQIAPTGWKQRLLRVATTMAPAAIGAFGGGAGMAGAAEGAAEGAEYNTKLRLNEREDAEKNYQFQAELEKQQRDQAIHEKLTMAQIQAQKAYRTLMTSISARRAATGEKNADTAATNSMVNAANKAMVVVKKGDGSTAVIPMTADELTEMQKAKLGVDQANANLIKARTTAIPEQIKIAEERLKVQQGMLQKSLAQLELQSQRLDLSERSEDFKETGPTTSSRNMSQMAATVTPHIEEIRSQIHEAAQKHFIGPAAGRIYNDFMAGRVGSTGNKADDKFLGKLRTNSKLLTSAMLRTHFNGRGISLYGSFEGMLGAKRSEDEINGTLDEFKDYIGGYKGMGTWEGASAHPSLRRQGAGGSAADRLKRGSGSSNGANPPAGARIRDYTDLGGVAAAAGGK